MNWSIKTKTENRKQLNTYLHFGDDKRYLTTNIKIDNKSIQQTPYSMVYKLYEPLPDEIN